MEVHKVIKEKWLLIQLIKRYKRRKFSKYNLAKKEAKKALSEEILMHMKGNIRNWIQKRAREIYIYINGGQEKRRAGT